MRNLLLTNWKFIEGKGGFPSEILDDEYQL